MDEYRATMRPRQQGRTMEEAAGYKRGLLRAAEMAKEEARRLHKQREKYAGRRDRDSALMFAVKADTAAFLATIFRQEAGE